MGHRCLAVAVAVWAGCADRPLPLRDAAAPADFAANDLAAWLDLGASVDADSADLRAGDLAVDAGGDLAPRCQGDGGALLWAKLFEQGTNDWVGAAQNGDIVLSGGFVYHLSFGGTPLTTNGGDSYLARLDRDGHELWAGIAEGASAVLASGDVLGSVRVGPDGGSSGGWLTEWSADGAVRWQHDVTWDEAVVAPDGAGNVFAAGVGGDTAGNDAFVIERRSPQGEPVWRRTFVRELGGTGAIFQLHPVHNLAVTSEDNLLVTASLVAAGGLGDGEAIPDGSHQLLQYDGDGALAWKRVSKTMFYTHVASRAGVTVVAGVENSSDIVIERVDRAGTSLWRRSFHSAGGPQTYGLAVDADGNSVWVGSAGDVDFGDGVIASSGTAIVKLDAAGRLVWARILAMTPLCDTWTLSAQLVAVDGQGAVVVSGCTKQGAFDFCGTPVPAAANEYQIILLKISP